MSCIWFNPYPLTINFFDIPYPYIFPLIMSRRNSDIAPKPGVITSPFTLPSNKLKKTKYLENMHSSSIIFFFCFYVLWHIKYYVYHDPVDGFDPHETEKRLTILKTVEIHLTAYTVAIYIHVFLCRGHQMV